MGLYGRTRRAQLAQLTVPSFFDTRPPELLVTFTEENPKPITLLIAANFTGFPPSRDVPSVPLFLPANLGGQESAGMTIARSGALLLEYGAGAARSYIFADIKSGAFALPPCDFAQVSVVAWHPHASGGAPCPAIDVSATFLEGQHKNPARFTSTSMAQLAAGAKFNGVIPQGARWVDVQGGHSDPGGLGTITPANVRFLEEQTTVTGQGCGRYIVHDWANGVHVPDASPVELAGGNGFTVWNDGASDVTVTTKFFLDL